MSGFAIVKKSTRELDWSLLEIIVADIKKKVPLLLGLVLGARSTFCTKTFIQFYLIDIKVIIVLFILYRLAYQNNSNYFPLLIILYLYFTRTRIDAITLLNHLSIFICIIC